MRQEMTAEMAEQGSGIKENKNNKYKLWKINNFKNDYLTEFGVNPEIKEIETGTKFPVEEIKRIINYSPGRILSLDESINSESEEPLSLYNLYNLISNGDSIEDSAILEERNKRVLNFLGNIIDKKVPESKKKFTKKEHDIICKYNGLWGEKMSLGQIAKEYSLTKERIRQIKEKGLEKITLIIDQDKYKEKIDDLF
jgi:RNA polymerase primary sigma factor